MLTHTLHSASAARPGSTLFVLILAEVNLFVLFLQARREKGLGEETKKGDGGVREVLELRR